MQRNNSYTLSTSQILCQGEPILSVRIKDKDGTPAPDNVTWEKSRHLATPTLHDFPAKWHLRNERRDFSDDASITRSGSSSDWLKQVSNASRPIRNTSQIWVVTRHLYARFSDVISRGNQWRRLVSAVFQATDNHTEWIPYESKNIRMHCVFSSHWKLHHEFVLVIWKQLKVKRRALCSWE